MEILFEGNKNISILPSGVRIVDGAIDNLDPQDSFSVSDDFLSLTINDYQILYDMAITPDTHLPVPANKLDVYIADITQGYDYHLTHLETIGGAKFIIPFPTVDQMRAVDFCREVMMKRLGVPKYFVAGQSLSLLV